MRIAVIVAAIVTAYSSAYASNSCMTQAEARRHFGGVHLYWHGAGHCWDATPGRHRLVQRAKTRERRQAGRDAAQAEKPSRWAHESRWREAMSAMLPEDAPRLQAAARMRAGSEPGETPSPRINWRDRWVDVAPRAPPIVDASEPADLAAAAGRDVEPMVTPSRVVLAFFAVLLTLAVIEILFRTTIHEWGR